MAARGCSRDGEKGRLQTEYGLLTEPERRPFAVRMFAGKMVMADDRGMIARARVAALCGYLLTVCHDKLRLMPVNQ